MVSTWWSEDKEYYMWRWRISSEELCQGHDARMYEFLLLNTLIKLQVDDEYDSWHFKGKDGSFITRSMMRAGLKHSAFVHKLFWDPFGYSHFDYLRTKMGQNIFMCALKCRIKVFLRFPFATTGCSMPMVVAMALDKTKELANVGTRRL